jgi:predicted PurR-regulated permease PerM
MAEETGTRNLSTEVLPSGSDAPSPNNNSTAPSPPAATDVVRSAPAAVKRSMPMALSITLGLLLAVAAGLFLYKLTWFILILYLSFIVATVLEAPVHWLTRKGIRRGLASMLLMVGGALIVAAVLYAIGNGLASQATALSKNLQDAPAKIDAFVADISKRFPGAGERLKDFKIGNALAAAAPSLTSVLSNAMVGIEAVTWLVITFFLVLYMLVDGPDHLKTMRSLLPKNIRLDATKLFNDISKAHRGWALASAANVASSSILTGTGLFLIGVPGAFILGFFAGLGELIPNIGPLVAAAPAILITLVATPDKFLYVAGMFVVVWTIQGYTISPLMMKFSVKLPVLVTIIAVLVFGTLFGILGILVSIPFVADMVVIWQFSAARLEKDSTDYDAVNAGPADRRQAMRANNTEPSRLQKLFRRNMQRQNPGDGRSEATGSFDRLAAIEERPADTRKP